jgi:hypothetical protein
MAGESRARRATLSPRALFMQLQWIDGTPLVAHIEPYRWRLFEQFFEERGAPGRLRYNLGLFGRAKKNWKTADLVFACFYALLVDSPGGNQVYIVANDEDQAGDDLTLCKKIIAANPVLKTWLRVLRNVIERKDGGGFIEVLPAKDISGSHGKTYRLLAVDEIHGYRDWDLLEALAPDPSRLDCQTWMTSYASIHHQPGAPLFDLYRAGCAGTDPTMLFSWYSAGFCTDPDFADATPEDRANPSRASWGNDLYLAQQQRRLPAHKYRRLHLNLPGLPEGSAFQPEPIAEAIERGMMLRPPEPRVDYRAFVDMSGGSADDAVLAVSHCDGQGRAVLDRIVDQGERPPFDPRLAVGRFVTVLQEYRISYVTGDAYGGQTFRADFATADVAYHVSERTTSQIYEALEPLLNGGRAVLLDVPRVEQQLLGLMWRGGKITHQNGEHDDWACAAAGALVEAMQATRRMDPKLVRFCLRAGGIGEGHPDPLYARRIG